MQKDANGIALLPSLGDSMKRYALAGTTTGGDPVVHTQAGQILAANPARQALSLQNIGTHPLFVKRGPNCDIVDGTFDKILAGGQSNNDGLGGSMEDTLWKGIVSIAGTNPRAVVIEEVD